MRQLNKTWKTSATNVIKLLSEITMQILTLDSAKPSVQVRPEHVSHLVALWCLICLPVTMGCMLTTSRIITNEQLMLCLEKSEECHHKIWKNFDESFSFLKWNTDLEPEVFYLEECEHFLFSFERN